MDVKSTQSLSEFFHDAVTRAIRNQRVDTTEMTQFYLTNLLADFARTPLDDDALAIKMCQGLSAAPGTRAQKLREVGDTSLFVSGFFPDRLNRSLVDVDYYIGMGEVAYGYLSRMVRGRPGEAWRDVFLELSDKFARFVEVLSEISQDSVTGSPVCVLRLYEKYLKTGSSAALAKLRQRGFYVRRGTVH
ncbi:MAG TPA: hypothetical protein VKN99_18700 [Polyangia bacterium]|nr:hypothetical protein [Polyangia bacterium]